MKMIQVTNGEIVKYKLPKVGTLKDGRTVSGYHLLDKEILKQEGWLHLEDIQPIYDAETQYLANDGYEILEDKVIKKYRVENIPEPTEPQPSEMDILKAQNKALIDRADFLEDVITEVILTVLP